jgi:hypothetical protein
MLFNYRNVKAEKNQVVYADAANMSEIRDTIFGFIEPGKDEWRILAKKKISFCSTMCYN